jgi:hypothetical protein
VCVTVRIEHGLRVCDCVCHCKGRTWAEGAGLERNDYQETGVN